jgi:hypothetical protein
MPRHKREEYQCPCCAYTTPHKTNMRFHLYKLQKPCPKSFNNIELTDDIKQHIMNNRIYMVPKETPQTINQTINNYNTINNFIANMDFVEKLSKYMSYNNMELIDYNDKVEAQYLRTRKRLEKDQCKYIYKLTNTELMEIVDEVSSICNGNFEELNIHFEEKTKKLKIYNSGAWETVLQEVGVQEVIRGIKDNYLDMYECYLVRRLYDDKIPPNEKMSIKEHLFDYYKFMSCFKIDPFIKGKTDDFILNGDDDDSDNDISNFTITDNLIPQVKKVVDMMTISEVQRLRKEVIDIIKRNSKQNIDELNKKVASLFNMDETFKSQVLEPIV